MSHIDSQKGDCKDSFKRDFTTRPRLPVSGPDPSITIFSSTRQSVEIFTTRSTGQFVAFPPATKVSK